MAEKLRRGRGPKGPEVVSLGCSSMTSHNFDPIVTRHKYLSHFY